MLQEMGYYYKYINLPSVRKAIHVGNLTFNDGMAVEQHLMEDVMQSVKPWIEEVRSSCDLEAPFMMVFVT